MNGRHIVLWTSDTSLFGLPDLSHVYKKVVQMVKWTAVDARDLWETLERGHKCTVD